MPNPKATVIMPAYNAASFLDEAIKSVITQSWGDFEFIIINDGSTDTTAQIIANVTDPRVRVLTHAKNQGLVRTLNEGIDQAKGEYLIRMDADDVALPNRFQLQVEYLDQHPDVGVVGGWAYYLTKEGNKGTLYKTLVGTNLSDLVWRYCPFIHPATVIRASYLAVYGLSYEEDYLHAEDYALWCRMSKVGVQMATIKQPVILYRVHNEGISARFRSDQLHSMYRAYHAILGGNLSLTAWKSVLRLTYRELTATQRWKSARQLAQTFQYPLRLQIKDQIYYLIGRYFLRYP